MHELTIARHILEAIHHLRDERDRPPCRVHVRAGEFTHLSPPTLRFAFDNARSLYALENCELVVENVAPQLQCRDCGLTRPFRTEVGFVCPCGSRQVEISQGRELLIDRVEFAEEGMGHEEEC